MTPPSRPTGARPHALLRVIERFALGCWVLSVVIAVLHPDRLTQPPLDLPLHVRTDTFGAAGFLVAAAVSVPRRRLSVGRSWRPWVNGPGDRALPAPGYDVAAAAADLALLVALYIAGNWIHHPRTMPMPLTHFASWPSERLTGAVAFVLAVAAGWHGSCSAATRRSLPAAPGGGEPLAGGRSRRAFPNN